MVWSSGQPLAGGRGAEIEKWVLVFLVNRGQGDQIGRNFAYWAIIYVLWALWAALHSIFHHLFFR
jgi:hypothetical protein